MSSQDLATGKVFAYIFEVFFLYLVIYFFFFGIRTQPFLGDNWDYHIPIAQLILTGEIIYPPIDQCIKCTYPGASEALLAILMIFGIPFNLFNVVGIVIFYFVLRKLGSSVGLSDVYAVVFAGTVCSITSIAFRMFYSQSIDIYIAIYALSLVNLLFSPKPTLKYAAFVGFLFGMLIGTKYSGIMYAGSLLIVFYRSIRRLRVRQMSIIALLTTIFGFSWYIRNFFMTGNPLHPHMGQLFPTTRAPTMQDWIGWQTLFGLPNGWIMMLNALISELKIWGIIPLLYPLLLLVILRLKKDRERQIILSLFLLAGLSWIVFLNSSSWYEYDPIVSTFRYSYTAVSLSILTIFLLAKKIKYLAALAALSFANLIVFPPVAYYPKLIFILLPLAVLLLFKKYNAFRG